MLLLYYNPTNNNYYLKYYKRLHHGYRVGYTNQYEHVVVKVFVIQGGALVDVESIDKFISDRYLRGREKETLKKRLIRWLLNVLDKD